MLFVLPFIVMAISFFSTYIPPVTLKSVPVKGVINIAFINELNSTGFRCSVLLWCWGWPI